MRFKVFARGSELFFRQSDMVRLLAEDKQNLDRNMTEEQSSILIRYIDDMIVRLTMARDANDGADIGCSVPRMDETKIYCQSCGTLCGMIVTGSKIRKESVMLCRKCFNRMHTADEAAKQTVNDMPDFLKNLFTGGELNGNLRKMGL